jgi:hypothetical protein
MENLLPHVVAASLHWHRDALPALGGIVAVLSNLLPACYADDDYSAAKKDDGPTQHAQVAPKNGDSSGSSVVIVEDTWSPLSYIRSQLKVLAVYSVLLAASGAAILHSSTLRLPVWAIQALYGIGELRGSGWGLQG